MILLGCQAHSYMNLCPEARSPSLLKPRELQPISILSETRYPANLSKRSFGSHFVTKAWIKSELWFNECFVKIQAFNSAYYSQFSASGKPNGNKHVSAHCLLLWRWMLFMSSVNADTHAERDKGKSLEDIIIFQQRVNDTVTRTQWWRRGFHPSNTSCSWKQNTASRRKEAKERQKMAVLSLFHIVNN